MPKEEAAAPWRAALDRYRPAGPAREPAEPASASASASAGIRLALQFQMRETLVRGTYQWNGPTSRAIGATKGEGTGEYRLGVRPAAETERGWASGVLTWTNLPHVRHRLNLDVVQHRWFCEFGALHRAGGAIGEGLDADWIHLDGAGNPVLWRMLDQADALGVPLVVARSHAPVRRAGRAALSLDVARTTGGLVVRPRLAIDGEPAVGPAGTIGDHGLYLYDPRDPRRLVLAEFEEPLDAERRALLATWGSGGGSTTVPEADADELLRDYLPALREHVDLTSADASVPLPSAPPPRLMLTATFAADHALALEWRWQRTRGSAEPPPLEAVLPAGLLPDAWLPDAGPGAVPRPATLAGTDTAEFATRVLPRLKALPGLRVEVLGSPADYRELDGEPLLRIDAVPAERPDWFDLGVTVTVEGRTLPFTPLFRALAQGRRRLLLADGSHLSLTHPAFAPLAALIEEAADLTEWETGPLVSRYQAPLFAEFQDLAGEARPAVEWRALLDEVREAPRAVAPPAGLRAELRPYQAEGLAWLAFLWRHRLGGVLADDMGLGKTLQCLALVQRVAEGAGSADPHPFLVVAPTSVVSNWAAEAGRFTPGLVVRTVTATEAKSGTPVAALAGGAHVVVTTYALLRLDFEAYQAVAQASGWAGLILDEAQFVKNPASRVHECARDLEVPFKLAVTGTPLENSLTELRALFVVVAPGLFPSARRFTEEYVHPIEQLRPGIVRGVGSGNAPAVIAELRAARLSRLRRRIRPFLLRRTKAQVAADLPVKQEQVLTIELAPEHRALYDVWLQRERRKLFGLLPDMNRNRFIVFRSLTLLRMLALDASLLGGEYAGTPSSKLDALLEQLDDVLAEGHRALVFSQFPSYLAIVAARLKVAGVSAAYLDGGTRDRDAAIAEFREGEAQVFLISLKAGGFGLNLTEADYVFLLDPWWNPASENQAIDRTHRIGQTRNVIVYRLVAASTIEEKVMALKEQKAALFDAVIDDEALFGNLLTADDVRGLLS